MTTSVHITHRNDFIREGLQTILHQHGLTVTGTSKTCHHLHEAIESQAPDVVVIDAHVMQEECMGWGGIDGLKAHSVITTDDPNSYELAQVIAAGATGYVTDHNSDDLLVAIQSASAETHPIELDTLRTVCKTMTQHRLLEQDERIERLTSAELRVLTLLSAGHCNSAIATELNVTVNTVKTHLRHVFAKLSFTDRTQAALWAARHLQGDLPESVRKVHPQG